MFCIGHSHIRCVEEAAQAGGVALDSLNLWGFGAPVLYDGAAPRLNPDLIARLKSPVFSVVGGSAHDLVGLVRHPRPFDLILPDEPGLPLDAGAELLPADALKQVLAALMPVHLDLIRLLPSAAGGPVFHFESPPPYPDDDALTEHLAEILQWPVFARFIPDAGEAASDAPPSEGPRHEAGPRYLRYKLWRLHSQIIREACQAGGAVFVPRPDAAVDAEGFLKPELFAFAGHANQDYGAMILKQMKDLAG